jgi:hypothetical protein
VCDAPGVSMAQVITYIIGTDAQWTRRLAVKRPISTCDEELLFGASEVGACPAVALAQADRGLAWMFQVNRAPDALNAERSCGVSKWKDAIVLSQVPMQLDKAWSLARGWQLALKLL